jgi:hypothetical protein
LTIRLEKFVESVRARGECYKINVSDNNLHVVAEKIHINASRKTFFCVTLSVIGACNIHFITIISTPIF